MDEISLSDFADQLRCLDLAVTLPGQGALLRKRALLGKVRGALGHALALWASPEALAGAPCPFDPPCAYDLFHNAQGAVERGREMPKPFVLRADRQAADLTITLRLFGAGCDWAPEFRAGLIAGLRAGLDLGRQGRLAMEPVAARRHTVTTKAVREGHDLILETVTPVTLRLRDDEISSHHAALSLLHGFAKRVEGMANWHGLRLAEDPAACLHRLSEADLTLSGGFRAGSRGRAPRRSFHGKLALRTPSRRVTELLRLAPALHLGADTTIGAGRCALRAKD